MARINRKACDFQPEGMTEKAIILTSIRPSAAERNLGKLLDFFGLSWSRQTLEQFFGALKREGSLRLFCSTDTFLRLVSDLETSAEEMGRWRETVHSVFVYGDDNFSSREKLAARLGIGLVTGSSPTPDPWSFIVADDESICGAMAGVRIRAASSPPAAVFGDCPEACRPIISFADGAICISLEYQGVTLFVSTSDEIVDLEMELTGGIFDIREHAISALAIVLYVKWAFPLTSWRAPSTSACLVIDDPLLKRTHGFVDFARLLSLMKQHRFSTNIAFIPWNWRRTNRRVVKLFLANPEHYSISIHGCDHTRAEFGDENVAQSRARIDRALSRMSQHADQTGLRHDRVMVFPQGVFSTAAMAALKESDLIAAVNNDTISADSSPLAVMIRDVWDVAVMKYGGFPLFTRRYPWEGLENFAFDALLGKPAILVIHHDACSDDCRRLVEFIDQLNHSKISPVWRNLDELVRRSYRQRWLANGTREVEMYATQLQLRNTSAEADTISVRRKEAAPDSIQEICIGPRPTAWNSTRDGISFEAPLKESEEALVKITFKKVISEWTQPREHLVEARIMLRRYLCEVRDNYVTRGKMIFTSALGRKDDKWV